MVVKNYAFSPAPFSVFEPITNIITNSESANSECNSLTC